MATRIRAGLYTETWVIDHDTTITFDICQNDIRNDYENLAKVGEWVIQYTIHSVSRSDDDGIFERSFARKCDALAVITEYMHAGRFVHNYQGAVPGWCYIDKAQYLAERPAWKQYHVEGCTCRIVDALPDGQILLGGIDDCPVHGLIPIAPQQGDSQ